MSPVWGHRLEGEPEELSISYCAGRDVKVLPMADEILMTDEPLGKKLQVLL